MRINRIIFMNILAGLLGFLFIPHEKYGPHFSDLILLWPESLVVVLYLYGFIYDRFLHKQRIKKISIVILVIFALIIIFEYNQYRAVSVLSRMELFRYVVLMSQILLLIVIMRFKENTLFLLSFAGITFVITMLPFIYVVFFKEFSYHFIEFETAFIIGRIAALSCVAIHSFLCIYIYYENYKQTNNDSMDRNKQKCLAELRNNRLIPPFWFLKEK